MEFSSDDFEAEGAAAMEAVAGQVRTIKPLRIARCTLPEIGNRDRKSVLADIDAVLGDVDTAIYAMSLPDADPLAVHAALTNARDAKLDGRCYSRILPIANSPTTTLYVGSSRSLRKRLLEHLGFGAKKTYSLHLRQWGQGLGPVVIDARHYSTTLSNELLCALEDHMATRLVPLFGKRGSV